MLNTSIDRKIIVVEDDLFSQEFYRYLLKRQKYNPLIIEDGDLLLDTIEHQDIEMVIMDINLKSTFYRKQKVDGIFLSRKIKENFKHIPVLLVSAYSVSTDGPGFFHESLADDYIGKPILDFNDLLNKINTLVGNGRQ